MSSIPVPIATNNLRFYSVQNLQCAPEGPRGVPLNLDFSLTTTYSLDLASAQANLLITLIQAFYYDNSASNVVLTFYFPDSDQSITVPAGSQGYMNCLCPGNTQEGTARINFISTSGNSIKIKLLNFPVINYIWQVTGNSSGQFLSSQVTLTQADIQNLATTPKLCIPGVPGKTIIPLGVAASLSGSTVPYTAGFDGVSSSAAYLNFGLTIAPNNISPEILATIITALQADGSTSLSNFNSTSTQVGVAIYLVNDPGDGFATFLTGSLLTASVTNGGALYAVNDTGSVQSGDGGGIYTVTGETLGVVDTVVVAGGVGNWVTTTPRITSITSGVGNGDLTVTNDSITPLGDGAFTLTIFYTLS